MSARLGAAGRAGRVPPHGGSGSGGARGGGPGAGLGGRAPERQREVSRGLGIPWAGRRRGVEAASALKVLSFSSAFR